MNLRSACLIVCLLASACAGAAEPMDKSTLSDERANPYTFNRSVAYTLLRTNQPMEASRVIQRMLSLKPDEPEPHYMLGVAYLDMRQYDAAERALRSALRRDEKMARAWSMLGVLYDNGKRHGEAEQAHKRAIALAPKEASFRNNLGFSYYLAARYRDAVGQYKAALERDMSAKRIHNNLAFAYGKLSQMDKAEEHFKFAGPPAQAWNNLAYLYEEREQIDLAYQYYLIAVQTDPLLAPARESLERVCLRLGRPVPEVKVELQPQDAVPPPEVSLSSPATSSPEVSP